MNPPQQRRDGSAVTPHHAYHSSAGELFRRFMEETMREMNQAFSDTAPYWSAQPSLRECSIGNAVGGVRMQHKI
ncbi:unnamed protein product [Toxocara canis]|uniref:Cytoplasmic protein n=1 Tax=Toxocara canis TaxID=6265 RepID=A0A183VHP2_TOXCA|nr:unnamed protein product [Toxocara canis]